MSNPIKKALGKMITMHGERMREGSEKHRKHRILAQSIKNENDHRKYQGGAAF